MSNKTVYGPKDFGKPPLLLGFRRSFHLNVKDGTKIMVSDILDTSRTKYESEDFGVPTHWRANMGSLKLYSEKDIPLNTRIDRKSMKEIPISLLQDINEKAETIIIKKGLFRKETIVKKETWCAGKYLAFKKETQNRIKIIERPSYYFDFEIYGTADVYWFT